MPTFPSVTKYPKKGIYPNRYTKHLASEAQEVPIEITDEFTDPFGRWLNYSAIPTVQEEQVKVQEHADIRSFVPEQLATKATMFFMDRFTMYSLDETELALYSSDSEPAATIIVVNNEGWTFGTVGPQSDRNNWNGLKMECPAGQVTTTQSVIIGET